MNDSIKASIVINPTPPTTLETRGEAPDAVLVAEATDRDAERDTEPDTVELAEALWFLADEPDRDSADGIDVMVELPETIRTGVFVTVAESERILSVTRFSGRVVTLTDALVPLGLAPVVAALTLSSLMPK